MQAVLAAMGIRSCGLAAACTLPLALTAVLFAGPLAQLAVEGRRGWAARTALPLEVKLRNWAVAPLVEEFVFRACLISFLLASGAAPAASAWLSPLLFGAAHLHHAYDLVRFQRYPLRAALAQLLFQLAYTTLFGWLAAHLFVSSRHLAAAALPHAFCNFMGPPAPPPHGAPYRRGILAAYTAGVLTFILLLRWLLRPELYCNAPS